MHKEIVLIMVFVQLNQLILAFLVKYLKIINLEVYKMLGMEEIHYIY